MADELDANSLKQDSDFAPLGEVLLAARNAKSLSQNDVSNTLRISVRQINAIERNDFLALPESAITRGFIRNYARLLGVDAEPLLASHRARLPDNTPASLSVKTTTRHVMARGSNQSKANYFLAGLGILVLLAIWFFYNNYYQERNKDSLDASENELHTKLMPEVALPPAERQTSTVDTPLVTSNSVSVSVTSNLSQSSTQANNLTAQQQTFVTDHFAHEMSSTNTADSMANNKISLKFTEQTWVRAKNQSGKVIFEKTFAAGDVSSFDAEPPITMTIGNANATQLQYLGQPVDLTAVTVGNVARVKLP